MKPVVETPSSAAGFVYTVLHLIEDIFSERNSFALAFATRTDNILKPSVDVDVFFLF